MSEYAIVKEGMGHRVNCPHCQKDFWIKQRKTGGAYYAKDMRSLTRVAYLIVEWWFHKHPNKWFTRAEAYRMFHNSINIKPNNYSADDVERIYKYKMVSFVGRMSEMVGLGLFHVVDAENSDNKIPRYTINNAKALEILHNGGEIKNAPDSIKDTGQSRVANTPETIQ